MSLPDGATSADPLSPSGRSAEARAREAVVRAVAAGDGSYTPFEAPVATVFLDALRARRKITFVLADCDTLGNRYGLTDLDNAVVYLDEANTLGEMRATITHELTHLNCPDCEEEEVEAMTAELLVPLADALAAHARDEIEETAERLLVDGRLIRARLRAADAALLNNAEAAG